LNTTRGTVEEMIASVIRFVLVSAIRTVQPDEIFIRRALVIGGDAPGGQEFLAVPDREDGVGVAAVDGKKHRPSPWDISE
jgi:hypothetical protein